MIRYKYPLKVSFGYQSRVLAVGKRITSRGALVRYKKYLANKYKIPASKISEWRS